MAGVGRKSDFGKPEFTDAEVENRLDTVDPFVDENLTYEENVQRLMACGLSENMAMRCVDRVIIERKKSRQRKEEILRETTEFREEIGDLKSCKRDDESCLPPKKDTK
jgi:uncharacterized protein YoaH (UPF0181 family)